MTRDQAVELVAERVHRNLHGAYTDRQPSQVVHQWAGQLLDAIEPYIATRQADALEWAADESVCAAIDTDAHGTAEERTSLRAWAHEVRTGGRSIPPRRT